jgi:hypothetical protein
MQEMLQAALSDYLEEATTCNGNNVIAAVEIQLPHDQTAAAEAARGHHQYQPGQFKMPFRLRIEHLVMNPDGSGASALLEVLPSSPAAGHSGGRTEPVNCRPAALVAAAFEAMMGDAAQEQAVNIGG